MTYAPQTLLDLAAYWKSQGGVSLGIVGNAAHLKGYHLGKDRIFDGPDGPGLGWDDYSVQLPRDKAGLSNAASAIDLGRLDGSLPKLWEFSRWLAQQCMDGKPGYRDVREVIFWSEARNRVIGWSARDPDRWINDYGDLSHKTHTHISFFRDSEDRDKRPLFRPYFAPTPPPEDDDMPIISSYIPGQVAVVKATDGANVRSAPSVTAPLLRRIPAGSAESWVVTGWVKGEIDEGSDQWLTRWDGGKWEYTHKGNVASVKPAPDSSPYTQAQLEEAKAAAYAKGKADNERTVTVSVSDGRPPIVITKV